MVVEDRPIGFGVQYSLPVIFWLKLTHAAVARSLCDFSFQAPSVARYSKILQVAMSS